MSTSNREITSSHAIIVNGKKLSEARHASVKVETDRRGRENLVRMELEIIRKINDESAVYYYVIDYDSRQDEKTVETQMSYEELAKFEEHWYSNWNPMLRPDDDSDEIKSKVINYEPLSHHYQYTGQGSDGGTKNRYHERRSSKGGKKNRSHDKSKDCGNYSHQRLPERPSFHEIRSSDGSKDKRRSNDSNKSSGSSSRQSYSTERDSGYTGQGSSSYTRSSHERSSDGSKDKRRSHDSDKNSGSSSRQSYSSYSTESG